MSSYTQVGHPLSIRTPLGPDALLLTAVEGHEEISGLFRFRLTLLADRRTPVPFEEVLGKQATVAIEMPPDGKRYVDGIICRLGQGGRDATFTHLEAELVPRLWLLTRRVQSRIFQRMTVPDILEAVLAGIPHRLEVVGSYEPRDYCTQYRESDFAFVSRLMEEEGIRYYFAHSDGAHEMVVTDAPLQHPAVPGPEEVAYEEIVGRGRQDEMRVLSWKKTQEIRSSLVTLRDHTFELPGQSLEAQQATIASVPVGEVSHEVKVLPDELEVYDFPGGYAQRFDGSTRGGSECNDELKKIFPDGLRTVRVRMEQEEMAAFEIRGESTCRHLVPGHQFTLTRHFDANGPYVLTRVEHRASLEGDYRSGGSEAFSYENRFTAIPVALPCRPPRVTPRPVVAGTQTATVVTPPGEELWCDRYGRVKVQFHWDRVGTEDLDSSCWVRVAQAWAGRSWGTFYWPRAGNEVVVAFEEGDPDQPIVVGSVYNAENMPPFELPLRKELAGVKSASLRGFANQHFNGLVFIDTKGAEHLAIHSQRTMEFSSELDKSFSSGRNKHEAVSGFCTQTVGSLAGGGGGGGGPTTEERLSALEDKTKQEEVYTLQGNTSWHPFGYAGPTGTMGIQASTVFGENMAVAVPMSHTFTFGSSLTLTMNPVALARECGWQPPKLLDAAMAGGLGGSATFVVGTNATFVVGKTFNISTEDETKVDIKNNKAVKILMAILAVVSAIYLVLYELLAWDIARTIWIVLYEATVALLLLVVMTVTAGTDKGQDTWTASWKQFFVQARDAWKDLAKKEAKDLNSKSNGTVQIVSVLAAMFLPMLLNAGFSLGAGIAKQAKG